MKGMLLRGGCLACIAVVGVFLSSCTVRIFPEESAAYTWSRPFGSHYRVSFPFADEKFAEYARYLDEQGAFVFQARPMFSDPNARVLPEQPVDCNLDASGNVECFLPANLITLGIGKVRLETRHNNLSRDALSAIAIDFLNLHYKNGNYQDLCFKDANLLCQSVFGNEYRCFRKTPDPQTPDPLCELLITCYDSVECLKNKKQAALNELAKTHTSPDIVIPEPYLATVPVLSVVPFVAPLQPVAVAPVTVEEVESPAPAEEVPEVPPGSSVDVFAAPPSGRVADAPIGSSAADASTVLSSDGCSLVPRGAANPWTCAVALLMFAIVVAISRRCLILSRSLRPCPPR